MTMLPPEFTQFARLFDAQPSPVQVVFQYCFCLLMAEIGRMRLVEVLPGESGPICIFETAGGDRFSMVKPPISQELEADLIEELREILDEAEL